MEFVSYFLERTHRMTTMSRSLKDLMSEKAALQRQENELRESYAKVSCNLPRAASGVSLVTAHSARVC